MDSVIVHVASRSPSVTADGGSGQFEWRFDRVAAALIAIRWITELRESENVALTAVEVPDVIPTEITDWLDANWHLMEVSLHSD